jgi:prepilin-type N-terminal cleavage/methylation domain-containing protein
MAFAPVRIAVNLRLVKTPPSSARRHLRAFTLIELLTVMAVVAILVTLLFTAVGTVKDSARRAQAKHDLLQIVAAVNAYSAEYGVYPVKPQPAGEATEVTFTTDNSDLVSTLSANPQGANRQNALNPKRIAFLEVPLAKDPAHPRSGLSQGIWYDPWGSQPGKPESGIYHIRIDATYRNLVSDPYPGDATDSGSSADSGSWGPSAAADASAGAPPKINAGVIAWSLAKTGVQTYELQDQVLSWK